MIKVTIELYPYGFAEGKKTLGVINIGNDCTGTEESGNYRAALSKFDGKGTWKKAEIKDFPRIKLGVYDLLYRILKEAVGKRNGG